MKASVEASKQWKLPLAFMEASIASMKVSIASMEAMEASMKASVDAFSWKLPMEDMEASTREKIQEASMEVVEDAAEVTSAEAFTKASISTEKLPRKLQRKHFHGFLRFTSMEASGNFPGRSEAPQFPRKVGSYIHGILRFTSIEASAASTESQRLPRQLSRIYLYCTLLCLR